MRVTRHELNQCPYKNSVFKQTNKTPTLRLPTSLRPTFHIESFHVSDEVFGFCFLSPVVQFTSAIPDDKVQALASRVILTSLKTL